MKSGIPRFTWGWGGGGGGRSRLVNIKSTAAGLDASKRITNQFIRRTVQSTVCGGDCTANDNGDEATNLCIRWCRISTKQVLTSNVKCLILLKKPAVTTETVTERLAIIYPDNRDSSHNVVPAIPASAPLSVNNPGRQAHFGKIHKCSDSDPWSDVFDIQGHFKWHSKYQLKYRGPTVIFHDLLHVIGHCGLVIHCYATLANQTQTCHA